MIRDRRARLLLRGTLCLLIGLFLLCMHPYVWKTESRRMAGAPIALDVSSDFLVVVDYAAFDAHPDGFGQMSFSLSWLNTFQQEIGPVSLLDAPDFERVDLTRFRCIVLTRSASSNDAWTPRIRNFLETGGTVIMEMPKGALRTLASADGKGGDRTTQSITFVAGVQPVYQQAFSALNLSNMTRLTGSAGPLEDARTWMTIDGVPVVYSKHYATGTVITVDFDYGMLLTSLQQGRPLDDFTIRNMHDSPRIETSDLGQVENIGLPTADILERVLIHGILNDAMPVVSFWPYFDGMAGAVVVTHREDYYGDAALWMPQYESSFQATSTVFLSVPPAVSDDGIDRMNKMHTEAGLAFDINVEQSSRAREPMGFFRISPVWRQLNLDEQAQSLKDILDQNAPLLSSQARDGFWTTHYTHGFQMLSASGFRADASYRATSNTPGYAFHCGLPFMPLDTNGLVFNILEFPVAFPELSSHEAAEMLEQYLANSEQTQHETITVAFDPGLYPATPDVEIVQTWLATYRMADAHNHWVTSILNYFRFSRARYTAELKTRTRQMQIGHKRATVLRIDLLAPESGMSITVPRNVGEHVFSEARRGEQRVREDVILNDPVQANPVSLSGFERLLVPLHRGFNTIDIIYE